MDVDTGAAGNAVDRTNRTSRDVRSLELTAKCPMKARTDGSRPCRYGTSAVKRGMLSNQVALVAMRRFHTITTNVARAGHYAKAVNRSLLER